jgi:hypothetical protein
MLAVAEGALFFDVKGFGRREEGVGAVVSAGLDGTLEIGRNAMGLSGLLSNNPWLFFVDGRAGPFTWLLDSLVAVFFGILDEL